MDKALELADGSEGLAECLLLVPLLLHRFLMLHERVDALGRLLLLGVVGGRSRLLYLKAGAAATSFDQRTLGEEIVLSGAVYAGDFSRGKNFVVLLDFEL